MQNILSIICQNSVIDSDTNAISLYNCIEEISVEIDKRKALEQDKIVLPIAFDLVTLWLDDATNTERKFFVEVDLVDPSKKTLNIQRNEYVMKKGIKRFRGRIKANGLPLTQEGRYWFKIKMKEKKTGAFKEVAALPLDVNIKYKLLDIKNNSK